MKKGVDGIHAQPFKKLGAFIANTFNCRYFVAGHFFFPPAYLIFIRQRL